MTCREIKEIGEYGSAYVFVKANNLEKKFEEKFGETLDEWVDNMDMADQTIITELLDEKKGEYVVDYNEHTDCLIVYELEPQIENNSDVEMKK